MQSSVSLQHLPYDKELEKNVEASIAGRLSFATQKLAEIVKAAKDAPSLKDDQIKAGLPDVGMLLYGACITGTSACSFMHSTLACTSTATNIKSNSAPVWVKSRGIVLVSTKCTHMATISHSAPLQD